ncbi:unnamed protein product [Pleuronectes platessa]|uniref:Uncharacterized protein n=1 Tax=Pleuronectes platessa TaxID=8262 RepID=A0A9N7TKA5_PLEPL|nr:unnamed protein product [Pleuronectes platessa]
MTGGSALQGRALSHQDHHGSCRESVEVTGEQEGSRSVDCGRKKGYPENPENPENLPADTFFTAQVTSMQLVIHHTHTRLEQLPEDRSGFSVCPKVTWGHHLELELPTVEVKVRPPPRLCCVMVAAPHLQLQEDISGYLIKLCLHNRLFPPAVVSLYNHHCFHRSTQFDLHFYTDAYFPVKRKNRFTPTGPSRQ